jgi:hypothetical protein
MQCKSPELLENLKAMETTKESEMINLNVKNSIDNNRQSAAKTLSQFDMGKVQRLEGNLVSSSELKWETSLNNKDEDIVSSLLKNRVTNKEYYVYVLLDPRKEGSFNYNGFSFNYEPFYVGFGKNDRDMQHIKDAFNYQKERNFLQN